jgi:lipoprotein-releasing system permease protein
VYKLLLCWRYLRTRYIALASVVSVTLGVATMIVVNSVMAGFSTEMQDRIHSILSDVVVESHGLEGAYDADWHMECIRKAAGDDIIGMTPTVHVPAMLSFQFNGRWVTRAVQLIGVDEQTQAQAGDLGQFLQHPANRQTLSWDLRDGNYDDKNHQNGAEGTERPEMARAGWAHRIKMVQRARAFQFPDKTQAPEEQKEAAPETDGKPAADSPAAVDPALTTPATTSEKPADEVNDPFAGQKRPFAEPENVFDPLKQQHTGLVMGIALASFRDQLGNERFLTLPGDDVKLTFPTAGTPPRAIDDVFTVVDFYESKMSEYDSSFIFIPIRKLQELRGMIDPRSGIGYFTAIQIKLKPGVDGNKVRDKIRAAFPPELYGVLTWRDKQGPLLAAVQMETAILNVLLFLIIAVAGFGILAIFFMIVVEKTRDIGILKSLGASGRGIQAIFLTYGLSLGMVGSGVGMVLGLLFVVKINEIASILSYITGHEVFDPNIYYFYKIPTIIDPFTIAWIVCGAMAIAVLASVMPARRAARLHPVEALRHE